MPCASSHPKSSGMVVSAAAGNPSIRIRIRIPA